MKQRNSNIE